MVACSKMVVVEGTVFPDIQSSVVDSVMSIAQEIGVDGTDEARVIVLID